MYHSRYVYGELLHSLIISLKPIHDEYICNAPFSTLHHSDIFHSLYTPHISMNIIIPLMHLTRPVHGKSDKIS